MLSPTAENPIPKRQKPKPKRPKPPRRAKKALALRAGADGGDVGATAEAKEVIRPDLPIIHSRRRSIRATICEWAAIRAAKPRSTNTAIAEHLGISPQTLASYIMLASKEGWLVFDEPYSVFEYDIIPKSIRNLNELMDKRDKQATLETVKGTVFKTYLESKGITEAPQAVLAIKIEQPEGTDIKVFAGHIVGKPKTAIETI